MGVVCPATRRLRGVSCQDGGRLANRIQVMRFPKISVYTYYKARIARAKRVKVIGLLSIRGFHRNIHVRVVYKGHILSCLGVIGSRGRRVSMGLSTGVSGATRTIRHLRRRGFQLGKRIKRLMSSVYQGRTRHCTKDKDILVFVSKVSTSDIQGLTSTIARAYRNYYTMFSKGTSKDCGCTVNRGSNSLHRFAGRVGTGLGKHKNKGPFFMRKSIRTSRGRVQGFFRR